MSHRIEKKAKKLKLSLAFVNLEKAARGGVFNIKTIS